ncbi:MAG: Holliday junction resolvase RuvX [Calditrichaeota bacterium]|nr:MAG: Holliday junction resolvase RuvX [Calditrichota bacterium]
MKKILDSIGKTQTRALPKKGRLLAIDFGERRLGIAVTDELQITAQIKETIEIRSVEEAVKAIKQLFSELKIQGIVLGLPLNLNGSEGQMSQKVRDFAENLQAEGLAPIVLWDERLTSRQAERTLRDFNQKPASTKSDIDKLAAYFILRSYLDSQMP